MEGYKFESSILKWAREKRFGLGLEVIAPKLASSGVGMTVELVNSWESGTAQPTFPQVKKLAEIYKRPLAVFFLDSPPEETSNPPDLRTIGSKDHRVLSPDALLVIRKARRIQEVSEELREELKEPNSFKYSKYSLSDNPIELAEKVREDFDIPIKDQFKAKKFEDFFEYLRSKIEETGVITLKSGSHDSFPTEDCRAFSFADKKPYLILVNNKDYEGAKNFSLLHEFAHILLREAGICNNFKAFNGNRSNINKLEVFCNQFAANFLVPKVYFLTHPAIANETKIDLEELDAVANRMTRDFKVSRVVILRRLLTFELISSETYESKIESWNDESIFKRPAGGTFSLKTTLLKNGKAFSSLVVEARKQKKISYAGLSEYLGLKTKHLSNFEKLLNSYGR